MKRYISLALLLIVLMTWMIGAQADELNPIVPDVTKIDTTISSNHELIVQLFDDEGKPWAGQNITFTYDKKVFVSPKIATTNETGFAVTRLFVGYKPSAENTPFTFLAVAPSGTGLKYQVVANGAAYAEAWIQIGLILAGSIATIVMCAILLVFILRRDAGSEEMRKVSDPIREGAHAFLRTQYITITVLSVPVALILFAMYALRELEQTQPSTFSNWLVATIVMLSFLFGCTLSGVAGFIGMVVAVRANIRVASAATRSYSRAFLVAVHSGAFAGFLVVTLSVLGVGFIFTLLYACIPASALSLEEISPMIVGFAFGASFSAIFAQLGGGIFTKAADVGADLVGKVESNIPEDDVRNPAVIADLVGDNVGDCAGRSADIFESLSAENISCMIIAGTLAANAAPQISAPVSYILFPLLVHIVGMAAGWAGIALTRVRDFKASQAIATANETEPKAQYLLLHSEDSEAINNAGTPDAEAANASYGATASALEEKKLTGDSLEDPTIALGRGYLVSSIVVLVMFVPVCFWMLRDPMFTNAWWAFCLCGLIGIATSACFVVITVFYTDYNFLPVKRIVRASMTGAATNVIEGISVGMESTMLPVIIISIALLSAFYIGKYLSGIVDDNGIPIGGLYGTAVATVGMLSMSSYVLMMDVFGPISDNAGGIVEMSNQPEGVRLITDKLDACGNTTKAMTKGFAIGSAALASFLLFSAFLETITAFSRHTFDVVNLATVEVFVGGLVGACLVFLFSSLAIRAVGKSAQSIIVEVRRQFREHPGIMTFEEKPDYAACVSIVTRSALKEMVLPGTLVVVVPVVMGFVFRAIGHFVNEPFLGASVTAGLLIVATITGILMALFLNNAGGAWDNAKKAVELVPEYGGKGSDVHKAAVVGDTIGDPFKDTAGPSIHVLIKLLASLALVVGPLYVNQIA